MEQLRLESVRICVEPRTLAAGRACANALQSPFMLAEQYSCVCLQSNTAVSACRAIQMCLLAEQYSCVCLQSNTAVSACRAIP